MVGDNISKSLALGETSNKSTTEPNNSVAVATEGCLDRRFIALRGHQPPQDRVVH